jgi:hypothetical protein
MRRTTILLNELPLFLAMSSVSVVAFETRLNGWRGQVFGMKSDLGGGL